MKALLGLLIIASFNLHAAPISKSFEINFHDFTNRQDQLEVRLEVKCSYINLLEGNTVENCGESAYELNLENDGRVYVPEIEVLDSFKKENYKLNFYVVKTKDNGEKVILNENNPLMLKIHSSRSLVDFAFYHCPKLNVNADIYTCQGQDLDKSGGYILEPKNMGDASKVEVLIQKGSKVLVNDRIDYRALKDVLDERLSK